jgi:Sulfotransferase domain
MTDQLKLPPFVARLPRNGLTRRLLRWRPPAPPPGWRTGPPDFVGVGAQRAGSSWWYRVGVESHPHVARVPGRMKELQYFTRFWHEDVPPDFVASYHDYFPRPEGAITGEWTPRYMFDHWSMRMLREAAPDAKVLVILRDPVERYRSALEAWRPTRGRQRKGLDALAAAVARSAYADQLRGVFASFPRAQVLVLQYEKCTADPAGQMRRTWEFLGLDPGDQAGEEPPEETRAPRPKPELAAEVRADLVARLRRDVEDVADLCPELDVSLWRNFA